MFHKIVKQSVFVLTLLALTLLMASAANAQATLTIGLALGVDANGRVGTERHPDDAGVHERQQLLQPHQGRSGLEAVDAALDVVLEVDVGGE